MKVVMNTYPVAFQCPGGGEIQLLKSIEALEKKGIEIIRFDPWRTDLKQADIVHYFSVQGGSMNFCGYVYNQRIPLVISPIIWLGQNPEIYPVAEIAELLRVSDVICPNSDIETEQLSTYFDISLNKFCTTYNGIDEIFTQQIDGALFKEKYSINSPFILCVGNIEPRKNQLNLIKATSQLGLKLILIGNIRDDEYYRECMKASDENTYYIGYLEHHDPLLRSAYNACELFALPSMLETPGLAALEASASNANILITEVGSTREYFGETVTYTSPESHLYIKEGILKALSSTKIPATNHIYNNFSWENTANQLINAYNIALERHNK